MLLEITGIILLALGSALFGMLLGSAAERSHIHFRAKIGMVTFATLALIGIVCIGTEAKRGFERDAFDNPENFRWFKNRLERHLTRGGKMADKCIETL
jgi:hypothetical protein